MKNQLIKTILQILGTTIIWTGIVVLALVKSGIFVLY